MHQKRYAYLIGANGPQTSTLKPLQYAERDAKRMNEAFKGSECAFTNVAWTIATYPHVTLSELEIFSKLCSSSDLLIVHFAGHAFHTRGHLYLLCNDTDTDRLVSSAIDIQLVKDILQQCTASHKLLILDCCHAGAALPDGFRSIQEIASILKETLQGSGSAILAACSSKKQTRELEELDGGAGFLTWAFASACTTHFQEISPDSQSLSLNDVWKRGILSMHKQVNQKLKSDEQFPQPQLWHVQEGDGEIWLTDVRRDDTEKSRRSKPLYDKEVFLKALLADHSSFMNDRLGSFVGRVQELEEVRQRIAEKQQIGGYITITGQAGQGKSSIIAKLVQEYGSEHAPFHFIPFNPGPDYQIGLLHNLMARLILKYDLSDLYVASESRAALRDYFPKVLGELTAKGGREVIFVDGLDQLEEEPSGERDLSFLPNNPPPGVVFVLGTRPNDTLRPLQLLNPSYEYQLPNLSREDFDLILRHRHVQLDSGVADQLYQAMQGNALYLDLMAKELVERGTASPEALVQQLSHNPEHLFSLAMARLKRSPIEWREVIKPVLGVLLVVREPLGMRHIRQILEVEDDRLRSGIERLGGLIVKDWRHYYSLFHLKLYEYLRQDESRPTKEYIFAADEEEGWHKRLAQWCKESNLSLIWQDVKQDRIEQRRREYARQHYLAHLYYAHEWQPLFEVLDTVQYGKAKIRDDPSTRSYAHDLDLGRQAAGWEGWTVDEGIALLPRLWQYTLLRCSLTSRADQYPIEAFRLLVSLKRKQEALGLAELLTKPANKARALMQIAERIREQSGQEQEWLGLFVRANEITGTIEDRPERVQVLGELGKALAQVGQWERAEAIWNEAKAVADKIKDYSRQVQVLLELGKMLAQLQLWEQAETIICMIQDSRKRTQALGELGKALAQAGQWERAEAVIRLMTSTYAQDQALGELGKALAQAGQWERADAVIRLIGDDFTRVQPFGELGKALAQAGQWELAEAVWNEIEVVLHTIKSSSKQVQVLRELGKTLAQAGQWERAEAAIYTIANNYARTQALGALGKALAQAAQWERAEAIWNEAETIIYTSTDQAARTRALVELGMVLQQAGQWERAEAIWNETETIIAKTTNDYVRTQGLSKLGKALAQAAQWERAEAIWNETETMIQRMTNNNSRTQALDTLGIALAQVGQWERAEAVIRLVEDSHRRTRALSELGKALAQAGQWERAKAVIRLVEDSSKRVRAWCELGEDLLQASRWEQAEAIWNEAEAMIQTIKDSTARTHVLRELGKALAKAGHWERAEAVWNEAEALIAVIEDSSGRSRALRELSKALAQLEQWERAKTIIGMIEDSPERVRVWSELGEDLAKAGHWERAEAVWNEAEALIAVIEDSSGRSRALRELGRTFAQVQRWEQAETMWNETEAIIYTIKDNIARFRGLGELGKALAQAGQWERAEGVIHMIEDNTVRGQALSELGKALAQAGQWERAEGVIRMIEDNTVRGQALSELGKALAQAGQWERAEEMWNEAEAVSLLIEWEFYRSEILGELGKALAQVGQWERAEGVIQTIANNYVRDQALGELSKALAQVGQWERAEDMIQTIANNYVRDQALGELSKALAQVGQWERAEDMIHTVASNYVRDQALRELTVPIAAAGAYDQLLSLIQRSWWLSGTRKDALNLFPMATMLIPHKPTIGITFCETFSWVDMFFND